jgi:hypothetical protein
VQRSSSSCRPSQLLEPRQRSDHRLLRLQQLQHLRALHLRQPCAVSCIWCRLNLPFLNLLLQLTSAGMPCKGCCSTRQAMQLLLLIPCILIFAASHA